MSSYDKQPYDIAAKAAELASKLIRILDSDTVDDIDLRLAYCNLYDSLAELGLSIIRSQE